MFEDPPTAGRVARLLDLDPDLADLLDGDRRAAAAEGLLVRTAGIPAGRWDPLAEPVMAPEGLGALLVEGIVLRQVGVRVRLAAELLGPGDLLRPWAPAEQWWSPETSFRVLVPVRLALLDLNATARLARHPELLGALAGRGVERAHRLGLQSAISRFVRVEDRIRHLFWSLAERWGRVTPGGVRLHLPLTHERLGLLVGARRPTVTTALGRLAQEGLVVPDPGGGWLLPGEPPWNDASP